MTFADRAGVGGRTFGRNAHLGRVQVRDVVSHLTGAPVGRVVEHGDGRVDARHRNLTVTVSAEEIHGSYREGRRWLYDTLRGHGYDHDQALRRMTRERHP